MSLAENLFFFTANKDLKYNEKVKTLTDKSKKLETLTNTYNEKFGDKEEEELTEADKKEIDDILFEVNLLKKEIEELQNEQQAALNKFNVLIDKAKKRLGVK